MINLLSSKNSNPQKPNQNNDTEEVIKIARSIRTEQNEELFERLSERLKNNKKNGAKTSQECKKQNLFSYTQ